jgi:hypothetical protein
MSSDQRAESSNMIGGSARERGTSDIPRLPGFIGCVVVYLSHRLVSNVLVQMEQVSPRCPAELPAFKQENMEKQASLSRSLAFVSLGKHWS